MNIEALGVVCITLAVCLEFASYYKQIAKTLRTKKSAHISSTSYLLKLTKYVVTIVGLAIYSNWVGVGIEFAALVACLLVLWVVIRYKPKGWRLFS